MSEDSAIDKHGEGSLYTEVAALLQSARSGVCRAVNSAMVATYWHIGRLIVEEEQRGEERAGYGDELLKGLSKRLQADFGRGFSVPNLQNMRRLHLSFSIQYSVSTKSSAIQHSLSTKLDPIPHSVSGESEITIKGHAVSGELAEAGKRHSLSDESLPQLRPELSWTHYRHLLKVADPAAREWYMNEAAASGWSTRALERQIDSLYYDRRLASRDPQPVEQEAAEQIAKLTPQDVLRDPYVLEFLDLAERPSYTEGELESALIDQLQHFLLELGKGFSFVARQKRITLEGEHFYIDLVFYNYLLKCFVVVDLKLGKLTHQDIGQIDTYVRLFEENERAADDNPTIGLVLCSEKNDAIAKYSVLADHQQLFASKYQMVLPTEEELARELEREKLVLERGEG